MPDNDAEGRAGTFVALLAASAVLVLADLYFLGIAIAFGPDGFGGDGHVPSEKALIEHLGQAAGFVGLLLGGAAVIWGAVGTLVLESAQARNRGLKWIVGAQFLALVALYASTY